MSSQAADNLVFIRSAMERSATFTAIPGLGGAVMGAIGLTAAVVGSRQSGDQWLATWLAAAVVEARRQPRRRVMDLLIAATAHAHDAGLYTRNASDFAGLEGLVRVISV